MGWIYRMQERDDKIMLLVWYVEGKQTSMVLFSSAVAEYLFDRAMHKWEEASRRFGEKYCPHLQ
jgi:hypothetical protein